MTAREASETFREEFPVFGQACRNGWDEATRVFHPQDDNRCRTTLLQMRAVIAAQQLFYAGQRFRYQCVQTMHLFVLPEIAVIRFKKLDQQFLSRNYPTPTAEGLYRQEGLPGFEVVPWLTVGVVPNADWTDYSGVFMTCPRSPGANNWVLDITSGIARDINDFETTFDDALEEPAQRRFRPRRTNIGEESSLDGSGV